MCGFLLRDPPHGNDEVSFCSLAVPSRMWEVLHGWMLGKVGNMQSLAAELLSWVTGNMQSLSAELLSWAPRLTEARFLTLRRCSELDSFGQVPDDKCVKSIHTFVVSWHS